MGRYVVVDIFIDIVDIVVDIIDIAVDIFHLPGDCAGLGEVTVGVGVAHRAVSADTMLILFYIFQIPISIQNSLQYYK